MIATTPRNRIAAYLDPPPLPTTPAGRRAAYTDAVFAAVQALQRQLASPDAAVALKAATLLLDLEKTRLRHHRDLPGTADELPSLESILLPPRSDSEDPPTACPHDPPTSEEVAEVRSRLQIKADEFGDPRAITDEDAVRAIRQLREDRGWEKVRTGFSLDSAPPADTLIR